ncbi:hypothetical protein GRF29_161g450018 [Pseudopithomyces chartarum]|uniref:Uncharacterized protein n=1 Tax=Pseudopithomyces chartarum TaxID=1892770 RepID=A0AAN6LQJ0_9PLEO|nr:hypothetical protein GRF29_161g450018 [Pseudopithomyces chartarum]
MEPQSDDEKSREDLSLACFLEILDFDAEKHQSDICEAAQFLLNSNSVHGRKLTQQDEISLLKFMEENVVNPGTKKDETLWIADREDLWNTSWSLNIEGNSTKNSKLSYLSKGAARLFPGGDVHVLRFFCGLNDNHENPVLHMMKNLVAQLVLGFHEAQSPLEITKSVGQIQNMSIDKLASFFCGLITKSKKMVYIVLDHVSCYHKGPRDDLFCVLRALNFFVTEAAKPVDVKLILTTSKPLKYITEYVKNGTLKQTEYVLVDGCLRPHKGMRTGWDVSLDTLCNRAEQVTGNLTPR